MGGHFGAGAPSNLCSGPSLTPLKEKLNMKMLLNVEIPHEPFNSLVRNGKAGEIIGRILDAIKPESAYFTEQDGKRGAVFVVNVQNPSDVPSFAEPFFLNFKADCKFRIAMSPEDLQKAGLPALGKKWA
jgi:hypothetical protein